MSKFKIESKEFKKYLPDKEIERLVTRYCESLEEVLKQRRPNCVGSTHHQVIEDLCTRFKSIRDGNSDNEILCLALNEQDTPIGFVFGEYRYNYGNSVWCFGDIFVEEKYRGTNAASLMYREFESIAKKNGAKGLIVHMYGNNEWSIGFCCKEGFRLKDKMLGTPAQILALRREDIEMVKSF